MEYAVVDIKGKQYQLKIGDRVTLDGTLGEVEKSLLLGKVLLVKDKEIKIGEPHLPLQVKFKVLEHKKSPKIRIATYRAKSRHRRTKGHRQMQTVLEVIALTTTKKDLKKDSVKATRENSKKVTEKNTPRKKTTKK